MANQRAKGKRLIGAQATSELWDGVDKWLHAHPRLTVTDFVLSACLEKLQQAGIRVEEDDVFRDGRARSSKILASSDPKSLEDQIADKIEAIADQRLATAKKRRSGRKQQPGV